MTVQRGKNASRPAVARADELPAGVAGVVAVPAGPVARTPNGRIKGTEAARALGRRGGTAKASRAVRPWARQLGLGLEGVLARIDADDFLAPYAKESEAWAQAKLEELAHDVGGGCVGAGVCALIQLAAKQRLFSTFLFDGALTKAWAFDVNKDRNPPLMPRTELITVASRLGDACRQNLLAAHELAAREAQARANVAPPPRSDIERALASLRAEHTLHEATAREAEPAVEEMEPAQVLATTSEVEDEVTHAAWLPCNLRGFEAELSDLRPLAADRHAFAAALLGRARALARAGRPAASALLHEVRAWMGGLDE